MSQYLRRWRLYLIQMTSDRCGQRPILILVLAVILGRSHISS